MLSKALSTNDNYEIYQPMRIYRTNLYSREFYLYVNLITNILKLREFDASHFTATFPDFQMAGPVTSSGGPFSSFLDSGLEPDHSLYWEVLTKNRFKLTKELAPDEKVLDSLTEAGVIDDSVKQDIDAKLTRAQKTQVHCR